MDACVNPNTDFQWGYQSTCLDRCNPGKGHMQKMFPPSPVSSMCNGIQMTETHHIIYFPLFLPEQYQNTNYQCARGINCCYNFGGIYQCVPFCSLHFYLICFNFQQMRHSLLCYASLGCAIPSEKSAKYPSSERTMFTKIHIYPLNLDMIRIRISTLECFVFL